MTFCLPTSYKLTPKCFSLVLQDKIILHVYHKGDVSLPPPLKNLYPLSNPTLFAETPLSSSFISCCSSLKPCN